MSHDRDLQGRLRSAMLADSQEMFPDSTPIPPLPMADPRRARQVSAWRRWAAPAGALVAVALTVVIVVNVTSAQRVADPVGGSTSSIEAAEPPCTLPWEQAASSTTFTLAGHSWRIWEQDADTESRFCVAVDVSTASAVQSSTHRERTVALQAASILRLGDQQFLWGVVTPAATRVTATDSTGRWSQTWMGSDFARLPTGLQVFVSSLPAAAGDIEVTSFDENSTTNDGREVITITR